MQVARSCQKVSHFERRHPGARAWAKRHGVLNDAQAHMKDVRVWTKEKAFQEAKRFSTRRQFDTSARGAFKWLLRNGLLDEACMHMEFNPRKVVWTEERVRIIAAKYGKKSDFMRDHTNAYQWAANNGLLDRLCSHMKQLQFWDLKSVQEEAKKYETRLSFRRGSAGAAAWAQRNGVFNEVCRHMPPPATKRDFDAVYMWQPSGFHSVVKFGATSARNGDARIKWLADLMGVGIEWCRIAPCKDARSVEKHLLSLGEPYDFGRQFNGSSEFRSLGPTDWDQANATFCKLEATA